MNCWDVHEEPKRSYQHLKPEELDAWAISQADKSGSYVRKTLAAVSTSEEGRRRKSEIMKRLDELFEQKADEEHLGDYKKVYRSMFDSRLEDPGLLENFEYFDIPTSEFMVMFYILTWTGRMADVMIMLHNYGWNLRGEYMEVPKTDVWRHMSTFEGMNISERKKVMLLKEKICSLCDSNDSLKVFSFGGGNEPLRLYDPPEFQWTIFDDGAVRSVDELFPPERRQSVRFFDENLFAATSHRELIGTQDFGYMFGVSMYLHRYKLTKALIDAYALLKDQGEFMFDVLFMTQSMYRVVLTQGWPKTENEMFIFHSLGYGLEVVRDVVSDVNSHLRNEGFFDIERIQPILVEPWGVTSIVFTLHKAEK